MAQPPQQDRNQLWSIFQQVDKDRSGKINATELQSALSNGTWRPFNITTVNMMIGLFDRTGDKCVDFDGFCGIWGYVNQWSACFKSFDRDNSGKIDRNELKTALTNFGYRLSDNFINFVIHKYDHDRKGDSKLKFFNHHFLIII